MVPSDITRECRGVGLGLRSAHHLEVLSTQPMVPWWEVHTENFFASGGKKLECLEEISRTYPLSFHGVGLSLGSADGIRVEHLKQIKCLVDLYRPVFVSEHVSWSGFGGYFINDLLPLPYNDESLSIICNNVNKFQDYIGRQILVENPSSYSDFKISVISEAEFILKLIEKTGCGLLLDINNVYVSSKNLGFVAKQYLNHIFGLKNAIQEIHLAGHSILENKQKQQFLVDTHDHFVCDEVWELYNYTISSIGAKPTLIEWDHNIPELSVLIKEAQKAQSIIDMVIKKQSDETSRVTEKIY